VPLTPVTRRLLTSLFDRHGWTEVIYLGRFEGMLRTLATANRVITRRAGAGLFDCDSLEEQRQYLAERFPHRRWRWLVRLLASAPTLNALLYRGAFPRRNIAMTAGEFFLNAFDRVFHTHVVKTTTFVQMLFFGRIRYPEGNPYEAQAHRFASIQDGARRATVKYVLDDAVRAVATSALPVDFVSLSDVPSFFKPPRERSFLQDLAEGVRPGGRVVVRGNLRVARPDPSGFGPDSDRFRDIIAQENTGIWHVQIYRRLQNTLAQSP
jgi:S-adenosylmethionine-diacylglycerol 3-amino-3-carboxypropyl transferase